MMLNLYALIVLLSLGNALSQRTPSGAYCGSDPDVQLRVAVKILSGQSVSIVANLAGENMGCATEDAMYDAIAKKL